MKRTFAIVLVLAVLQLVAACKTRQEKMEAAYASWNATMEQAESDAEKLAAAKAFLAAFPDNEHTRRVAANAINLMTEQLDDAEGADDFLIDLIARVKDAESKTALTGMRLGVLGTLGRAEELRAVAASFVSGRELGYGDRQRVFDAAVECGDWELALEHAEAALPLATPEVYQADYEKRNLSEQRIADGARRRRVAALAAKGWALANLDRLDEALPVLREAHETDFHGYMGNAESSSSTYFGRALLQAGKRDEAVDVLAVEALYGGSDAAEQALEGAFLASGGQEDGFDVDLEATRQRLAREADDFTLADYAGTPHTFSQLRNGEVALLSFWFPT